ncbi:transglycosylase domain-containing protein [Deinococcus yavapaiensis]|uniref:peptidoglycan glycosyltransferase n=1 Tax=Deinococcus yavapaiensis KR-236 TaxID=694435 RepID=A0A318S9J0_9DEIO|nr:transglycosylase domain-containing protein [Deinococcus yavapaiensis]PYE55881.1 membrane peptidoglycan carboxypeptidase [Deinococcus yavapaiensis KR-236]
MKYVWRTLVFLCSLVVALGVVGVGVIATYGVKWARELPDYRELDALTLESTTRVFARDLTPLGTLVPRLGDANVNRTIVSLDGISPYMLASIVTNEDRRFFEHYGVDPFGIGRQVRRILQNERVQGGSTLTNQLVNNTLLRDMERARTIERKAKEWILSVQVERSFTKEEILQDYLNVIYWGDGGPVELYGLHAAAQAYFGKSPRDLSLAEAAYLTTLVPSPGLYYPRYELQRPYMRALLDRMVEDGWVTRAQANAAWREKLQPRGWRVQYDANGTITSAKLVDRSQTYLKAVTTTRAPHFVRQVEEELIKRFGAERIYRSGGLNVYTTLDPQAQSAAELASRQAIVPSGATLGAVLLDPYTGEVLAMVGQKLVGNNPPREWNNAAQGQRQVGSSIKPLLYTTALSTGQFDQLHEEFDAPTDFPCATCPNGKYAPQNFDGKYYYRDMTLREALDRSLNIPTAKLAVGVGLPTFREKLQSLGLNPPKDSGLSLALGTLETTPLGMAAAYAPFVNGGTWKQPRFIQRVTTAAGEILYDAAQERPTQRRVWSPQVAYLGLDMLMGVVNDQGPQSLAVRAKIPGWQVGGKTGTTNFVKDLWFVGVTPMYVGAVWVGKQEGGGMGNRDFSGTYNPPIWRTMMQGALAGKPPRQFAAPEGITYTQEPRLGVEVAKLDPTYQSAANTQIQHEDERPLYREVNAPQGDGNTVRVALDRRNGRLATEFTPPEAIVERRVRLEDLPGYAPPANPTPLPEETPAPNATKKPSTPASNRPNTDAVPQAPVVPSTPSSGSPAARAP